MIYHQTVGQKPGSDVPSTLPCIVLVHGLTCDSSDWELLSSRLAAQFPLLVVDLRGHGQSSGLSGPYSIPSLANDLVELLTEKDIVNAILVGHSMGTRVIAAAARELPDRVSRLVFVDGSQQAYKKAGKLAVPRRPMPTDNEQLKAYVEKMFDSMFTEHSDSSIRKAITERAVNMNPDVFRELVNNMLHWDAEELETCLAALTQPVSILQSTTIDDSGNRTLVKAGQDYRYLQMLAAQIKQANTKLVEDCGHFIQLDQIDVLEQLISELAGE